MTIQALANDPSSQIEPASLNLQSNPPTEVFYHPLHKTSPDKCGHNMDDIAIIPTNNGHLLVCKCGIFTYLREIQGSNHPLRKKPPNECEYDEDNVVIIPTENVPLFVCKSCWIYEYFEVGALKPI